jgi:hypothetical protein
MKLNRLRLAHRFYLVVDIGLPFREQHFGTLAGQSAGA